MANTVYVFDEINPKNLRPVEVQVAWDGTIVTQELTIPDIMDSSHTATVYKVDIVDAFGANAGHTNNDLGAVEFDEAFSTADGSWSGTAATLNRIAMGAGTLAAQTSRLTLWVGQA